MYFVLIAFISGNGVEPTLKVSDVINIYKVQELE